MKLVFRRITSSGSFIPEIDGLRFIAIVSVLLYHAGIFLMAKDVTHYKDSIDYSFLQKIMLHGDLGVPLFFVISGYILGIPFANFHIRKEKPVNLKKYFLRRLTRLEPPYIVVMTLLLFGAVFVAKTFSLSDGIVSYLSSIIYSNNIIYPGGLFTLNNPAWSLEVEVQFYILAPLMAYIFSMGSPAARRSILIITAIAFIFINQYFTFSFKSLINYYHYFLVGFLLADIYVSKSELLPKTKFDSLIGLFFFVFIWVFETEDFTLFYQKFIWGLVQLASISILYYYILIHKIFRILTFRLITNIGGMCYSIYLIHYPVISMFGNPLVKHTFSSYSFINTSIYLAILLSVVMVLSSIFFLTVERPCMDKDWYKKIFKRQPAAG